jgi:DnaJ-class molecular chaperone
VAKHRDDSAKDDSGNSGDGRHRDKPGKCPLCNGSGEVRVNLDNTNEILRCSTCGGSGNA